MFCFRALLLLSACVVYGQKKEKTNVFTMRPISTVYLPHYVAGKKSWGINKDAAVKTAYDMDTKLAYSAGKKWIHVVDFADVFFPKILDKFESPTPLTDIAECGEYVAWAVEGAEITDSGSVVLYEKFSRVGRKWTRKCEFVVGSRPKSIKFTKDCSTIVVANEGVADVAGTGAASQWVNPEGTVSIIRLYGRNHQSQGSRGGGGTNSWGNQGGTNWGNAGGRGQWGNTGQGGQGNWNNRGQNTGGGGWNNRGQNQGPNVGGPNGGGRGWNNQGPNQGGRFPNQGPNNRGNGWNNQGPNQGGWGPNQGPNQGWGPNQGPNQGPNTGGRGWNNQGPNQGPNTGGRGWNNQGPNQGPNTGGQGWNNQGPNQGGRGPNQGPNAGGTGWNNRGNNQGPNAGGQGWNNQGPNRGGTGWNNQGPNQGGRGPNQGPNTGGQGWNNQGPNRGPNQGPNTGGRGWNNQGPNQGPNTGGRGWNNQGPNQGGRGPNQGPNGGGTGWNNQGPNQGGRVPNQGPNRGGTGWNNQGPHGGGARGNPQIPNQGGPNQGPNAGGTGWNRGQTNGPNAGGRFPNNGNPTWQQGRGQAGNNPPNNRPNNPGQGPWLIQHELGHLSRQKRQYPPPPQTPQWQPQTPQWQPQTPQWQPQTPRWQPPQRPTFPQTPARGPGGAPPQGPGFNPGRGQGQGPWQNPGQRPGQGPGQRPGQRPGQFPQTPARQNPGGPQGQSPRQGVTTSRGTCSGGGNFNPTVTTLDFTKFNPRADWFKAQLVRHPYTGQMGDKQENTFSQGLEPEYVTFDPMETTAYVSLQENNAIASVDLFSNEITGIHPLGAKQWKRYDLDPSPGNGRGFQKYDIESFRQPDAIESYTTANGDTYILTANEGKQLEYTCNLNACPPGGGEFVEFEKGDEFPEDYWLTAKLLERVTNEEMLDAFRLGNLEFSRIDGRSVEQPLKHDNVYFYGGRGISAYRVDRRTGNLTLAWDSGDIIEKATAKYLPKIHNGNNRVGDPSITMASTFDSWSDQRGPECESLAVGDVQGTKLIFVGIDRISAIAIFSVSPSGKLPIFESIFRDGHIDKSFTELYRTKRFGDSDPESLTFIPPEKSVDRRPYLMVTGRVSGTISLYQIRDEPIWMLLKNSPSRDFRLLGSLPVVLLSTVLAIVAGYRRLV